MQLLYSTSDSFPTLIKPKQAEMVFIHLHTVYQVHRLLYSASVDSEKPLLQTVSSTTGRFVQFLPGQFGEHISLLFTFKRGRDDHNRQSQRHLGRITGQQVAFTQTKYRQVYYSVFTHIGVNDML